MKDEDANVGVQVNDGTLEKKKKMIMIMMMRTTIHLNTMGSIRFGYKRKRIVVVYGVLVVIFRAHNTIIMPTML